MKYTCTWHLLYIVEIDVDVDVCVPHVYRYVHVFCIYIVHVRTYMQKKESRQHVRICTSNTPFLRTKVGVTYKSLLELENTSFKYVSR